MSIAPFIISSSVNAALGYLRFGFVAWLIFLVVAMSLLLFRLLVVSVNPPLVSFSEQQPAKDAMLLY
jgi:hypothetical protein